MNKLLLKNGETNLIYGVSTSEEAAQIVSGFNITDPALYQEFAESDFDSACYSFPGAFTLVAGVVGFDLDSAKQLADNIINAQSNEQAKSILAGLSYDVYVAQSTLPKEQRIAKYQSAIDANNAIAIETENREQAVYAASTIQEVNAIVYPPED